MSNPQPFTTTNTCKRCFNFNSIWRLEVMRQEIGGSRLLPPSCPFSSLYLCLVLGSSWQAQCHPAVWGGHLLLYRGMAGVVGVGGWVAGWAHATGVVLQRPGCAGRCPLWVFLQYIGSCRLLSVFMLLWWVWDEPSIFC